MGVNALPHSNSECYGIFNADGSMASMVPMLHVSIALCPERKSSDNTNETTLFHFFFPFLSEGLLYLLQMPPEPINKTDG
jgi:hypothetical protein